MAQTEQAEAGKRHGRSSTKGRAQHNGADAAPHEGEASTRERLQESIDPVVDSMQRWPGVSALVVAGVGLAAASLVGVTEVLVAGGAGYLAYRWLRKGRKADPDAGAS